MNQQFIVPDLTIFLQVSPAECLSRIQASRPHQEFFEELKTLQRTSARYQWLVAAFPQHIRVINGEQLPGKIAAEIFRLINSHSKQGLG